MTQNLAYLYDRLCIESVVWDIQRNDELSGSGDGRVWQAELAPPLWTATINVNVNYIQNIKELAARIRWLRGSAEPIMVCDPTAMYPAYDPNGALLAGRTITISAISTDRRTISLSGFSANYRLTFGDKFQATYSSNPTRYAFIEIASDVSATSAGVASNVNIFPALPSGIATGQVVTLSKPACQMIIYPGSFNPGTASDLFTEGLTFRTIQKK